MTLEELQSLPTITAPDYRSTYADVAAERRAWVECLRWAESCISPDSTCTIARFKADLQREAIRIEKESA